MPNSTKNKIARLKNNISDILTTSDFISRTIGMNNSYEDIMLIVQSLGREPVSLLGKDYLYIFDHVRRNYEMGTDVMDELHSHNDCPFFTFYKEKPTVKFANPFEDPRNLLDKWVPDMNFESTSSYHMLYSYAESNGGQKNKDVGASFDIENANPGVNFGGISSFANVIPNCDMISKTNDNFNFGKYKTLIARFHTDSIEDTLDDNITQTAVSDKYGMSKGRNLLKISPTDENGYDNPYCRVWTYHHQYNQLDRAIRPFGEAKSQEALESMEQSGDYNSVGFRTIESKDYDFKGGSARLDKYGVLNYSNGMVNIAPTAKIKDYFEGKEDKTITIKKCMFSIENLAWRTENINMKEYDQYGLSPEQKGPLGGRIMWFPPYDLSFNEDVRVNWNSNQFIGRGEKVYTYTDTERSGNLSFTLLIDHPSILDYWTGHERNGMKNQGQNLQPGNTGGVDNVDNQENTLLRFFAGCDILSAKPQEFWHKEPKPEKTPDPPKVAEKDPPETEVHKPPTHKKLYCFAFYPNNYSGKDDFPNNESGKVNAIHYLLNGIGTQRRFNGITKKGEDFKVLMDKNVTIKENGTRTLSGYGGYEVRNNGISIATKRLNSKESIDKTYDGATQNVQFLTNENGDKYLSYYDGSDTSDLVSQYLTKYSWDGALGQNQAVKKNGTINKAWYDYRYYYRVDSNTLSQDLHDSDTNLGSDYSSYIDAKSYKYNSNGIYNSIDLINEQFELKINDENENADVVSLLDMYFALEGKGSEQVFDPFVVRNKVGMVKKIIEDNKKYKITNITFVGNASSQGWNKSARVNKNRNTSLAKQRGLTFKNWLSKNGFPNIEIAKIKENESIQKGGNKTNVDDKITKLWRSAYVLIEYDETDIEQASVAESTVVDTVKNGDTTKIKRDEVTDAPLNKTDHVTIENGKISDTKRSSVWNYLTNYEKGSIINAYNTTLNTSYSINPDYSAKFTDSDPWNANYNFQNLTQNRYYGDNFISKKTVEVNEANKEGGEPNEPSIKSGIVERYDNEGEFFQLLESKDPFLHHLITDKIKYFDPAYHSISPEGFNARLTFLHQCTRQGSTVGGSDSQLNKTAYNLAFGRPPVCVLRLGDFFNTKIIINSVSIQYEQPTWDLNPEGIGVMPMFAKVNIGFVFLGGSDLSGPISRLQNAVSFNYYANTSVYDNRAEMVEYDPDGTGREIKFKPYSYPDMIHTNGMPPKKQEKPKEEQKKKTYTPVVEVGDVEIIDSFNYDTKEKTGWEGTVFKAPIASDNKPQVSEIK